MFTGLVADLGKVEAVDATADGVTLAVRTRLAGEIAEGDSIAVNGVCLTATAIAGGEFRAEVMHETLRRSSLAEVGGGLRVNLELALRASDRLGGHIVQGHVDGLGAVRGVREDGFARVVAVAAPAELLRYVVEKGSIAVNGVSLTVVEVGDDAFSVSLIPETLERTTLGTAAPGAPVNLEVDVVAKYVEKLVAARVERGRSPRSRRRSRTSARGRMVVVCDDEDRENEGDLTIAAEFATPEAINFMAREGRGLICLALTPERCDELGLDLMAAKNESPFETAFTVSVEAREGVTTGISAARPRAHDRRWRSTRPPRRATSSSPATCSRSRPSRAACWSAPARPRPRSTSRGSPGLNPAGVICEIMNDDGTMARVADLERYCAPARAQDDHGRRPDRVPAPPRQARRARRRDAAADRLRRVHRRRLPLARRRQAPRRDGQGRGRRRGRTCSCACTPSA